jgi:DNA-binding XRE family transcriptional regulator
MSDLQKYISRRKQQDAQFADNFDKGYQSFKIGVLLRQARIAAGITQEAIAVSLNTRKSAISRMENHAEDVKLSTLEKFAHSLGKRLEIRIC